MNTYKGIIKRLGSNQVFVFGTNLDGFHGAGAAGFAMFGFPGANWRSAPVPGTDLKLDEVKKGTKGAYAVKGISMGIQEGEYGMSYGICTVTKPGKRRSVSLDSIREQIHGMYKYARRNPELEFIIAAGVGRGLNGYTPQEMASVYGNVHMPCNITFNQEFAKLLKGVTMEKAINATGHRQVLDASIGKFVYVNSPDDLAARHLIERLIGAINYYTSRGINTYISGMALGFDMIFAEAAVRAKHECDIDIRTVAAVPFQNQPDFWRGPSKQWYWDLIARMDEIVVLFDNPNDKSEAGRLLNERNLYMVNRGSGVMSYFKGEQRGGTWNCIRYAKSVGKQVINIDPHTLNFNKI